MFERFRWSKRLVAVLSVLAFAMVTAACGGGTTEKIGGDASRVEPAAGLPPDVVEKGKLVVATGDYKVPTHFLNENGELDGLSIDVAKALEKRLGVDLELVAVPFDAVLAGIQAGRYDTAIFNVGDSSERREVVDFVDYALSGIVVVVRKGERGSFTTEPLSLCGQKVAVTAGQYEFQILKDEIQPKCEQEGRPKIDLQTYKDDATMQQALISGRAEAFLGGTSTTPYTVAQNSDRFELVGQLPIGTSPLGMPFHKGREDLVRAMQVALKDIYTSGDLLKIGKKWSLPELIPDNVDFFAVNSGEGFDSGTGQ